jgi:DNA-directed RNA polymerase subunit F
MRTQPEIESEIEYFKAFARATAAKMERMQEEINQLAARITNEVCNCEGRIEQLETGDNE